MMTNYEKERLIAELIALLRTRLDESIESEKSTQSPSKSNKIEMLTVTECAETVGGLSVHTVRQLVAQGKISHIRTGQGKNGKILVNKSELLAFFESGGAK
jgi:excisionase family DNA binding protein